MEHSGRCNGWRCSSGARDEQATTRSSVPGNSTYRFCVPVCADRLCPSAERRSCWISYGLPPSDLWPRSSRRTTRTVCETKQTAQTTRTQWHESPENVRRLHETYCPVYLGGGTFVRDRRYRTAIPGHDKVADKVIAKYQGSTCEELWQKKASKAPPSAEEQKVISFLKSDPQMRQAFIAKVAAPIANKMFDCGMIP